MKKSLILLVFILLACEGNTDNVFEEALTVEAFVAYKEPVKVYLTKNLAFDGEINEGDLLAAQQSNAKVTVDDGEISEVLTLVKDEFRYPNLVYKSDNIIGEEGKIYHLNILLNEITYTAETSVPKTPVIISTEQIGDVTTNNIGFKIILENPLGDNYYKVLVKDKDDEDYVWASPYVFNNELFKDSENIEFTLKYLDQNILDDGENLFEQGKIYDIKLAGISESEYNFFRSLYGDDTDFINTVSFTEQIETNIKGGNNVFGFWTGENTIYFTLVVE